MSGSTTATSLQSRRRCTTTPLLRTGRKRSPGQSTRSGISVQSHIGHSLLWHARTANLTCALDRPYMHAAPYGPRSCSHSSSGSRLLVLVVKSGILRNNNHQEKFGVLRIRYPRTHACTRRAASCSACIRHAARAVRPQPRPKPECQPRRSHTPAARQPRASRAPAARKLRASRPASGHASCGKASGNLAPSSQPAARQTLHLSNTKAGRKPELCASCVPNLMPSFFPCLVCSGGASGSPQCSPEGVLNNRGRSAQPAGVPSPLRPAPRGFEFRGAWAGVACSNHMHGIFCSLVQS